MNGGCPPMILSCGAVGAVVHGGQAVNPGVRRGFRGDLPHSWRQGPDSACGPQATPPEPDGVGQDVADEFDRLSRGPRHELGGGGLDPHLTDQGFQGLAGFGDQAGHGDTGVVTNPVAGGRSWPCSSTQRRRHTRPTTRQGRPSPPPASPTGHGRHAAPGAEAVRTRPVTVRVHRRRRGVEWWTSDRCAAGGQRSAGILPPDRVRSGLVRPDAHLTCEVNADPLGAVPSGELAGM